MTSELFWGYYVNERGCPGGKCVLPKPSSQLINSPPILSPIQDLLMHTHASLFHVCITVVLDSTHISASSVFLAYSYHPALASRWLLSRSFIDTSHPQTQGAPVLMKYNMCPKVVETKILANTQLIKPQEKNCSNVGKSAESSADTRQFGGRIHHHRDC